MAWSPAPASDGSLLAELRRMQQRIADLERELRATNRSAGTGSGSTSGSLLSVAVDDGVAVLTGSFPVAGSIAGVPIGTLAALDPALQRYLILTVTA